MKQKLVKLHFSYVILMQTHNQILTYSLHKKINIGIQNLYFLLPLNLHIATNQPAPTPGHQYQMPLLLDQLGFPHLLRTQPNLRRSFVKLLQTRIETFIKHIQSTEFSQLYYSFKKYVITVPSNSNSEFKNMLVQLINACVLICFN